MLQLFKALLSRALTLLTFCMWCDVGVSPKLALCFSEYSHVFLPSNDMNENNEIFTGAIIAYKLSMRAIMQSCSNGAMAHCKIGIFKHEMHENTFSQITVGQG